MPEDLAQPSPKSPGPQPLIDRLSRPTIRLSGLLGNNSLLDFYNQLGPALDGEGPIVFELFSTGGDADIGRRLAEEVRLVREVCGRDLWFVGKTLVASAAVTVMGGFPVDRRWLTREATLLIHGRRMTQDLHLDGPLEGCRRILQETITTIDQGLKVEDEDFRSLIEGSGIGLVELKRRAYEGWYLSAEEALEVGLVAGIL